MDSRREVPPQSEGYGYSLVLLLRCTIFYCKLVEYDSLMLLFCINYYCLLLTLIIACVGVGSVFRILLDSPNQARLTIYVASPKRESLFLSRQVVCSLFACDF